MLLLSFLFTIVSLLLIYALMRDTGKNTPHARNGKNANTVVKQKEPGFIEQTTSKGAPEAASLS